ncbi:twin-arginine translocase TatA/TatE family subunit [Verrucomicrobiota bacterium]
MNTLAFISPGGGELILIMLVLIMLFGAKDAPRILRKIHNFMDEIRRIANGFRYDMMYSDLHSEDEDKSGAPAAFGYEEDEVEEGEFENYDFEEDYGCAEEDNTTETDEPEKRNEAAEKTDQ